MPKTFKLAENSKLNYWVDFYTPTKKEMKELIELMPTEKHEVRMPCGLVEIPRYQQSFGKPYPFAGTVSKSIPPSPFIQKMMDKINELDKNFDFNMCLVNWYPDGDSYIGQHSDDTRRFVEGSPVYGLSLGSIRDMTFKPRKDQKEGETLKISLPPGSLHSMEGDFQKTHTHGIPKQKNRKMRISLTFRSFKE